MSGRCLGVLGMTPLLLWGLWHVTGAIQRRWGLDSVWVLLANGVLFVVVGLILGAVWRAGCGVRR